MMLAARTSLAALLAALVLCLAAANAGAVTIHLEDFNTDGAGTRYSVTGGGGGGDDFFGLQSIGNPLGYSGSEGADFFAGRDLNGSFGGNPNPRVVDVGGPSPIDISGYTGVTVSILFAAVENVWESGDPDFLRVYAVDDDTGVGTLLDEFLPNAAGGADLESATFPGTTLNTTFQDFTFSIPLGITNLRIRFEAYSTGNLESVGFDNVRVNGTLPEPGPVLLLAAGLLGLAFYGSRR